MARIVKEITLEVSKLNVFQAIVAKQYDSDSRFLKVTFVHDGDLITVAPTSTITINAKRPDGETKSFFGDANEDGTATVPLHSWILEKAGTIDCDVSIIDTQNRKLTSTTFTVMAQEASCPDTEISTDENYDVLTELINKTNDALNDVEDALSTFAPSDEPPATIVPYEVGAMAGVSQQFSRADHCHNLPLGVARMGFDVQHHINTAKVEYGKTATELIITKDTENMEFELSQFSLSAHLNFASPIVGDGSKRIEMYVSALLTNGSLQNVAYRNLSAIANGTSVSNLTFFVDWRLLGKVGSSDITITTGTSSVQNSKYASIQGSCGKIKSITVYLKCTGNVELSVGSEIVLWGC